MTESDSSNAQTHQGFEFEADGLSYAYGPVAALRNLSLRVHPGERVALLGANGSGKSTLLGLLDGLHFAQQGILRFRGTALNEVVLAQDDFAFSFRRTVGMVFQNPEVQLFNSTVFDEVAFGPLQMGWTHEEILDRVHRTLAWIGAEHLKDRAPYRLSGGEKKKVALASVVVLDPEVLLLDEPTSLLDPRSQSQLIELLEDWGGGRKTILTATHQLETLPEIADRAVVLQEGSVEADGTPAEILSDTALLESANLIHQHRHRHDGVTHRHPSPFLRHDHPER